MGIPKYFRYIAKTFEGILHNAPNVHIHPMHFYLDMNSIIHPVVQYCIENNASLVAEQNRFESQATHKYHTDMSYHTRFEKAVYKELAKRLDRLIDIVRPTKTLYMAVDGVAPRAKMEQQRIRRYKSGYERHLTETIYTQHQTTPPVSWDRNAITPGTVFLYKLCKFLENEYLPTIKKQGLTSNVYLDDANSPGEGEHKIFEWLRKNHPVISASTNECASDNNTDVKMSAPDTTENEIHCIYGLDADLIMLSLCNPNSIVLLREAPEYYDSTTKEQSERVADDLRGSEYIYFDIDTYKKRLIDNTIALLSTADTTDTEAESNDESVTHEDITYSDATKQGFLYDYVWMCFLFGNDFLPHFFGFDLKKETFEMLMKLYTNQYRGLRRHFIDTQTHRMDMIAVKQWFDTLYGNENDQLVNYVKGAIHRRPRQASAESLSPLQNALEELRCQPYHLRTKNRQLTSIEYSFQNVTGPFHNWRDTYYKWYFDIDSLDVNTNFIQTVCRNYLYGLEWNIEYYLSGCRNQQWYYPYRASPCLRELTLEIAKGNPILHPTASSKQGYTPIQQLLLVLPESSFQLLPIAIQKHVATNPERYGFAYPKTSELKMDILFKVYLYECHPYLAYLPDTIVQTIIDSTKSQWTVFDNFRNNKTGVLEIK
jgi:5'-3' exonuclease